MMTIKHLIAGAVVTAAVSTALVLGSAVGAQAQIFPTPTPVGPGSVNKPIYTQPGLPGFHLPAELWTKYGPQVKPRSYIYSELPTCATLFDAGLYSYLRDTGYALTTDTAVHATLDPQLLALIPTYDSISCDFVNAKSGGHIDVTLAIHVNDAAVIARLRALGYSEPGGPFGWVESFAGGRVEEQGVSAERGGWDLVSSSDGVSVDNVANSVTQSFDDLNS